MLHRCRHLKDKQINMFVKTGLTKITKKVSSEIVSKYVRNHQHLKVGDADWYKKITKDEYLCDDFYFNILVENISETIDSEKNFSQELLGRLTFNHNINVNIIPKYQLEDIDNITEKYKEKVVNYTNENMIKLMNTNKINATRYDNISSKTTETKTPQESLEMWKYNTLNSLRNNHPIDPFLKDLPKSTCYVSNPIYKFNQSTDKKEFYYSGIYTNYSTDKKGNSVFYVPLKEARERARLREEVNGCNVNYQYGASVNYILMTLLHTPINHIIRKDYDKDHLMKHSLNNALVHQKNLTKVIHRLNSNILIGAPKDKSDEDNVNNITTTDMREGQNKLKIIKQLLEILKIDREKLALNRYITTNETWKELFDINKLFIQEQLHKYLKEMTDEKNLNDPKKYVNISNFNSKNRVHYRYVKDKIINLLSYIGIITNHYGNCGSHNNNNTEANLNNNIVIQYSLQDKYINNFMTTELRKDIAKSRTFINTYYRNTIKNDIYYFLNKKHNLLNETINDDVLQKNLRLSKNTRYEKCDTMFYTTHSSKTTGIKKKRRILKLIWTGETNLPKTIELPHHIFTTTYTTTKKNEKNEEYDEEDNENSNGYLCLNDDKNNNKLYNHYKKNDEQIKKDISNYINTTFNTTIQPKFIYEDVNKTKNDISYYKYEGDKWTINNNDTYDKTSIYYYSTNKEHVIHREENIRIDRENKQPQSKQTQDIKEVVRDFINEIQ